MKNPDRVAVSRPATDTSAGASAGQFALSAVLLLRACVNAAITIWLLTHVASWSEVFRTGSTYAIVDGALGLATTVLLARRQPIAAPPALVAMVLTDAMLRLGAGLAIRLLPGLTLFPITLVLLFGALGVWSAAAGAMAIVGWMIGHEHHRRGKKRTRVHALFDPLSVLGVVALSMAVYALVVGPPATADALRMTAAVVTATLTVVFLAAIVLETRAVMTVAPLSAG
jgi:hypothetical protein